MQKKSSKSGDNLLETYFRQIKSFPLLAFEDELELSKQIQEGNKEALHKLVNCNLRLVVRIAGIFDRHNIPILDIIQEGNLGLIHAAEKFDYRKNVRFCTYASWWIRQYIGRFINKRSRIVRIPVRKEEAFRKIQRTYNVLCQTLMHRPENSDIAKEMGIPVSDVDSIINMASGSMPFDQCFGDDEAAGAIDIYEDYTYSPERNLMKQLSNDGTLRVLGKLKDREKRILTYRYQLNGCERHTLREIGDKFDISPETVRQIEIKALKKISSHANELKDCVYVEAI